MKRDFPKLSWGSHDPNVKPLGLSDVKEISFLEFTGVEQMQVGDYITFDGKQFLVTSQTQDGYTVKEALEQDRPEPEEVVQSEPSGAQIDLNLSIEDWE